MLMSRRQWFLVFGVSAVIVVAFGSMLYGFSVFVTDTAAGGEFSTTVLSLGLTGAGIVSGLLAAPLGRLMDRRGVRGVLLAGAALGGLGMVAFSQARQPWHVVAAWWVLLGPAAATLYYEPAFVAIGMWVPVSLRPRAFGVLTLLGGLAGGIFIPLVQALVDGFGWRATAAGLGGLIAIVTLTVAVTVVPGGTGRPVIAEEASERPPLRTLLADRRFVLFTAALVLTFLPIQGVLAHRVDRFSEVGFAASVVALWAGAASFISMPGRYLAPVLAHRVGAARLTAGVIGFVAVSVAVAIPGSSGFSLVGHFVTFGVAFGALTPLRAVLMTEWYAGRHYGAVMGAQWSTVSLVAAFGALAMGVGRDVAGDYRAPLTSAAAMLAAAAVLTVAAGRSATALPSGAPEDPRPG